MTLHISDLQVSYAGRTVLTDVTLGPVENGTITGLLGPNAAGKSTLVKTIAGLKKASGGRCQVLSEGREVTGPELRDVIGYVPQDLLTSASLTAFESILVSTRRSRKDRTDLRHQIELLQLIRREVAERNCLAVVAIHDLNLAARYCDTLTVIAHGRTQAQGRPEEVLTPDLLERVYGLRARVLIDEGVPVICPVAA